jgi:putative aldouronate transport system substrate-binding protein
MLKRIVGSVLLLVMMCGIMSGCTSIFANNNKKSNIEEIVWYTFGKKYTDSDKVHSKMNEIFQEKLGITVKWETVDSGAYSDKINLIISGGEKADICFTSNWLNKYMQNAFKGAYEPLDAMLETKATALKQSLPDFLWDGVKVDGKIYGVPNEQVLYIERGVAIQKKLAEKYNLNSNTIKSFKDLEPFLLDVKKGEKNIFPIRNFSMMDLVYEPIQPTNMGIKKTDDNLNPVFVEKTPEYMEFLKLKRDWFKKGLIREDVASVSDDNAEMMGLKYAVFPTVLKEGAEGELKTRYNAEFILIPVSQPYIMSDVGTASINAVLKQSKNKEKALAVLELMNTNKELYNLKCYGIEGEHYTKNADGKIDRIPGKYDETQSWAFGNQFNALILSSQSSNIWENTRKKNQDAVRSPFTGFKLNAEPVKNQIAQVSAVQKEYGYLDTGSAEIESVYNEYISKLKTAGIEDIKAEVEKQLKEWKMKNK